MSTGERYASDRNWVAELQSLGFSEYEARAYLVLLRIYPATAYEISKQAALPRANVYGVLENLTKKNAVLPVSEKPMRYVPVAPQTLFQGIAKATTTLCQDLSAELSCIDGPDTTQYVWIVTGQTEIHAKIQEMIASAQRHLWIKAPATKLEAYLPALRDAAARGIEIIIILFGPPSSAEQYRLGDDVTVHLHEGNGIVVGLGDKLITLTTDFQEALTVNTAGQGFGAHTRSRPVVNLAESLIRHEIYLAEIFRHFSAQIEQVFGPALLSLRRVYLPREQVADLERTVTNNRKRFSANANRNVTGE